MGRFIGQTLVSLSHFPKTQLRNSMTLTRVIKKTHLREVAPTVPLYSDLRDAGDLFMEHHGAADRNFHS